MHAVQFGMRVPVRREVQLMCCSPIAKNFRNGSWHQELIESDPGSSLTGPQILSSKYPGTLYFVYPLQ